MAKEGWGITQDEGNIIYISNDYQSKNGPFKIFHIIDKKTREIKRFQGWDKAYTALKNDIFYVGCNVSVSGWVHYYIDDNGNRQVRVKTDHILPVEGECRTGKIKMRLQVTSEWYKGVSHGKEIQAFSGKPIHGGEKVPESLVVRCYMLRTNVDWRGIKKGAIVDVEGPYSIEEDESGSRIVIQDVQFMKEIVNV